MRGHATGSPVSDACEGSLYLNPIIAGATMALSSVFVVSNSLRLRTFKAQRDGEGSGRAYVPAMEQDPVDAATIGAR